MTKHLVICLQALGRYTTERAQRYLLRHVERQIPVLIHVTQQIPSEIPESHLYNHPVTK